MVAGDCMINTGRYARSATRSSKIDAFKGEHGWRAITAGMAVSFKEEEQAQARRRPLGGRAGAAEQRAEAQQTDSSRPCLAAVGTRPGWDGEGDRETEYSTSSAEEGETNGATCTYL